MASAEHSAPQASCMLDASAWKPPMQFMVGKGLLCHLHVFPPTTTLSSPLAQAERFATIAQRLGDLDPET